jgi:glycosyltransferase involved in cell wall biosynthesis
MNQPKISIILPVYNRLEYLDEAIQSVLNQTHQEWELIIADDASGREAQLFLEKYVDTPNIRICKNTKNIGLFANLNQSIYNCTSDYILLLCSDDILIPDCLKICIENLVKYPEADLILSAFRSIDGDGIEHTSGSIFYYDKILSAPIQTLLPKTSVPLMLQHGSINGNLTGMFFRRSLFDQVGGFDEHSRQVADWEWVYRVARESPIVMSKTPIAMIRSHPEQLSAINFKSIQNSLEVIGMVKQLLEDPLLKELDASPMWARHIMQFHLWYAMKFALKGYWTEAVTLVRAIDQVTGLASTFLALLQWLPTRWEVHTKKVFPMPPS